MKVFYAGDSPAGGPANYLLAILRRAKAKVTHLPPGKPLKRSYLKNQFDLIILSDYSRSQAGQEGEIAIAAQVIKGAGLLMIGGWGSFSGPFGKWSGSVIEDLLPVSCLKKDDRINFSSGAWITAGEKNALKSFSFRPSPVLCGLNIVKPKKFSRVALNAQPLVASGKRGLKLSSKKYPLLVFSTGKIRSAALTTDLAPHWCGGLVDWGTKRLKLPVAGSIQVEIGDQYVRFVETILRDLARK